jgi:hypothetical protein
LVGSRTSPGRSLAGLIVAGLYENQPKRIKILEMTK